jgi:hypothetical protein
MLKTFTLSALVATVLATAASTAFAAPRNGESGRAPVSGAEWWQNQGNADEMGSVYRR